MTKLSCSNLTKEYTEKENNVSVDVDTGKVKPLVQMKKETIHLALVGLIKSDGVTLKRMINL